MLDPGGLEYPTGTRDMVDLSSILVRSLRFVKRQVVRLEPYPL
jgi:hypothetical protein